MTALLKRLQSCFASEDSQLHQACLYPIETGGKRIRPLFLFAGLEALGHQTVEEDAYTAAAAVELIHTYSLVHDDLPCMDDDDSAGVNQPSINDTTKALPYWLVMHCSPKPLNILASVKRVHVPSLIQLLGQAAGSVGMIGGQSLDIGFEGPVTSLERLTLLHRRKTGALIEVSLSMAAVLGAASPVETDALKTFGKHIGLAFQLADDILDAEEDAQEDGRQVLSNCWVNQKPRQPQIML